MDDDLRPEKLWLATPANQSFLLAKSSRYRETNSVGGVCAVFDGVFSYFGKRPAIQHASSNTTGHRLAALLMIGRGRNAAYPVNLPATQQSCIGQDVLGCPAEYHLPQSALRVGTLDQKVAAQRLRRR